MKYRNKIRLTGLVFLLIVVGIACAINLPFYSWAETNDVRDAPWLLLSFGVVNGVLLLCAFVFIEMAFTGKK